MSCHSRSSSICSSVRSSSSSPANNWNASWNSAICSSVLRLSWNSVSPASLWCVQKILELMYGKHKKSNQQIEPESIDLPSSALARIELLFVNGFPVGAWAIGPYVEFETVIEPVMFFVAALPPPMYLLQKPFTHEQIHAGSVSAMANLSNLAPAAGWAVEELVQTFMEQLAILQRKTMESQSRAKISAKLLQYASIWFCLKIEFLWVKVIMGHQVPNKIATKRCPMQASCLTHVCAWHFLDETLVQLPCQNWGSKW